MKNIYLQVIESCSREGESWFFIFDLQKQDLKLINKLTNFLNRLNKKYQEDRKKFIESDIWKKQVANANFFYRPRPIIANSSYQVSLQNEVKTYGKTYYLPKENWITNTISERKLNAIIRKYDNDPEKTNPFYIGGIKNILYKNK